MTEREEPPGSRHRLDPPAADMAALRRSVVRLRAWRMAGAAASIVVVVGVIVAWSQGNDTQQVDVVDDPTTTTATPTSVDGGPTTTERTETTPAPVGFEGIEVPPRRTEPPAQFAAVTPDGRLVVVETSTGREIRQLTSSGDPTASRPEEGPGPNVIDRVALSPDGSTVWYSECCEPAGGALFRVPTDGSARPTRVADGYDPALPASSRWVVAVHPNGAQVVDAHGGPSWSWWHEEAAGEHQEAAWSLDGRHLAVRIGMPDGGELLVVDPEAFSPSQSGVTTDSPPPLLAVDGTWRLPAFSRDGRILIAQRRNGRWNPRLLDPNSGTDEPAPFEYDRPVPLDHDFDPTGEWLLLLETADDTGAGTARWRGPDGSIETLTGTYCAISW